MTVKATVSFLLTIFVASSCSGGWVHPPKKAGRLCIVEEQWEAGAGVRIRVTGMRMGCQASLWRRYSAVSKPPKLRERES